MPIIINILNTGLVNQLALTSPSLSNFVYDSIFPNPISDCKTKQLQVQDNDN